MRGTKQGKKGRVCGNRMTEKDEKLGDIKDKYRGQKLGKSG